MDKIFSKLQLKPPLVGELASKSKLRFIHHHNGSMEVCYKLTEPGSYSITVAHNDQIVPGTPIYCHVRRAVDDRFQGRDNGINNFSKPDDQRCCATDSSQSYAIQDKEPETCDLGYGSEGSPKVPSKSNNWLDDDISQDDDDEGLKLPVIIIHDKPPESLEHCDIGDSTRQLTTSTPTLIYKNGQITIEVLDTMNSKCKNQQKNSDKVCLEGNKDNINPIFNTDIGKKIIRTKSLEQNCGTNYTANAFPNNNAGFIQLGNIYHQNNPGNESVMHPGRVILDNKLSATLNEEFIARNLQTDNETRTSGIIRPIPRYPMVHPNDLFWQKLQMMNGWSNIGRLFPAAMVTPSLCSPVNSAPESSTESETGFHKSSSSSHVIINEGRIEMNVPADGSAEMGLLTDVQAPLTELPLDLTVQQNECCVDNSMECEADHSVKNSGEILCRSTVPAVIHIMDDMGSSDNMKAEVRDHSVPDVCEDGLMIKQENLDSNNNFIPLSLPLQESSDSTKYHASNETIVKPNPAELMEEVKPLNLSSDSTVKIQRNFRKFLNRQGNRSRNSNHARTKGRAVSYIFPKVADSGERGQSKMRCLEPDCSRQFKARIKLDIHLLIHEFLRSVGGEFSDGKLQKLYTLQTLNTINSENGKPAYEIYYKCPALLCSKTFQTVAKLEKHLVRHCPPMYKCTDIDCRKRFHVKRLLMLHMSEHHQESHICSICGSSYRSQKHLKAHMRYHTDNSRQFVCSVPGCNSRFNLNRYLQQHMNTHKTTYDFLCQICGKAFKRSECLRAHLLSKAHAKVMLQSD